MKHLEVFEKLRAEAHKHAEVWFPQIKELQWRGANCFFAGHRLLLSEVIEDRIVPGDWFTAEELKAAQDAGWTIQQVLEISKWVSGYNACRFNNLSVLKEDIDRWCRYNSDIVIHFFTEEGADGKQSERVFAYRHIRSADGIYRTEYTPGENCINELVIC